MNPPSSPFSFHRLVVGMAGLLVLNTAAGQPADAAPADTGWRFQVTPYLWMAGLDGHIRPFQGAPMAHVDRSFSNLLKDLDAALFVNGTARRGQMVLYGDLNAVSTSNNATLPLGLPVQAKVRQTSLTLLGGHSMRLDNHSHLDLMGGVRFWDIKASVAIPGVASTQSNPSFVDPLLAMRWRHEFAQNWSALLYLDAGGLGVGSRFTWQAHGAINYQWTKNIYLSAGYRHVYVDYRSNGKHLDFSQGGPMLGATFRF